MALPEPPKNPHSALRILTALFVLLMVSAYTLLVLSGTVSGDRRIDAVHLVIILLGTLLCAVLLKPDLASRLRLLEVKGFKIELLERMQERQIRQEHELEDIRLIIPLLFRDSERKLLSSLVREKTAGYHGGDSLKKELRRLCSIGLLQRRAGHKIGELGSDLVIYDLADYVELTDLGRRWGRRLQEISDVAGETDSPK